MGVARADGARHLRCRARHDPDDPRGSGSGKSTLLRYLIGLERPLAGDIDIDGLGAPHRYEGVPRFGVLFQSGALFSSMTLAENLALPLTTWTSVRGSLVRELAQAKLDLVGLGPFAGHRPGEIRAA